MLPSKKMEKAFLAIVEEAEKLLKKDLPEKLQKRVNVIRAIAKHQSDIRGMEIPDNCAHSNVGAKKKKCGKK
ncbi:MAG: hypothetical protein CSA33_05190 [Desulfobulbus propionicus]|nr:MAG: hypothetical protein CSA33_05190 [Desulfobulbus propionicus]